MSPRSAAAAGSGAATAVLICWQAGQRTCFPACSSAIRSVRLQLGQRISSANIIKANDFGAMIAFEVRMLMMRDVVFVDAKAPSPIHTRHLVDQTGFSQPIECAVQGDAINPFVLI